MKSKTMALLLAWLALSLPLLACSLLQFPTVRVITGSGNVREERREVSGFSAVTLRGQGDVIITQGETESLSVEAEDNLLPLILTRVEGDTLVLDYDRPDWSTTIRPTKPIVFHLSVINLDALELAGSGSFQADQLVAESLRLTLGGSGNIDLGDLQTGGLEANLTGSGEINLAGTADTQTVTLSGSGGYAAGNLESRAADVRLTGSGDVTLWVQEQLDVTISGSGSVSYFGQPTVGRREITGSGDINPMGDK